MYDENDFIKKDEVTPDTSTNSGEYHYSYLDKDRDARPEPTPVFEKANDSSVMTDGFKVPSQSYQTTTEVEPPRWQPDPERYGSCGGNGNNGNGNGNHKKSGRKDKKSSDAKKWGVPLTIAVALIVVVLVLAFVLGPKYIMGTVAASQAYNNYLTGNDGTTVSESSTYVVDGASGYRVVDVTGIVNDVFPAVVSITKREYVQNNGGYGDIFSYFFGQWGGSNQYGNGYGDNSSGSYQEVESGIGSGTIIGKTDSELLILTSYHVVEDCSSLAVTFCNDVSVDGVIKSASDQTDIAIVSVPLENVDQDTLNSITIAKLSDDDAVVGEGVVVIGNAMGYGMSVTTGIVSAVNREITIDDKTIVVTQTDAAINSGNSGGCMLNAEGEIIGISEAKIIVSSVEGMCYAIPISNNSALIQELLAAETPAESETNGYATGAYLGIRGRDVTSDLANSYNMQVPNGVYVSSLVSGGGAEATGILEGDIIVKMDNKDTTTMESLQSELAKHNAGDVVTVTVMRSDGKNYQEIQLQVTLTDAIS